MSKEEELKEMLRISGFVDIEEYSDFSRGISKDAVFFIYVGHKPGIEGDLLP